MCSHSAAVREASSARPCPACGGPTAEILGDLYDDRYGYPGLFDVHECESCRHRFIPIRFTPDELGSLYTNYYPRSDFDVESFRPAEETSGIRAWVRGDKGSAFRWVPRNVRVLDIGCGVGHTIAYHRNRGCEAMGIEADENVQAVAARHGLDIKCGVFDGTQFEADYFDYVTLDQVAEHAVDPYGLLRGVARVLKPGGRMIITTPNSQSWGAHRYGRHWINWHVPYHLQFYNRLSLKILAERSGFSVERVTACTPFLWPFYQWRHMRDLPARGVKSHFWMSEIAPRERGYIDKLITLAQRWRLHGIVSRIVDFIGLGDNHIFILRKM